MAANKLAEVAGCKAAKLGHFGKRQITIEEHRWRSGHWCPPNASFGTKWLKSRQTLTWCSPDK
jgi:hypothetical protein